MTRGGILASGTAVALFAAGTFAVGVGSGALAQAKKEVPLETKGDASARPWKRYAGWPARDGQNGQRLPTSIPAAPKVLAQAYRSDHRRCRQWHKLWPIAAVAVRVSLVA